MLGDGALAGSPESVAEHASERRQPLQDHNSHSLSSSQKRSPGASHSFIVTPEEKRDTQLVLSPKKQTGRKLDTLEMRKALSLSPGARISLMRSTLHPSVESLPGSSAVSSLPHLASASTPDKGGQDAQHTHNHHGSSHTINHHARTKELAWEEQFPATEVQLPDVPPTQLDATAVDLMEFGGNSELCHSAGCFCHNPETLVYFYRFLCLAETQIVPFASVCSVAEPAKANTATAVIHEHTDSCNLTLKPQRQDGILLDTPMLGPPPLVVQPQHSIAAAAPPEGQLCVAIPAQEPTCAAIKVLVDGQASVDDTNPEQSQEHDAKQGAHAVAVQRQKTAMIPAKQHDLLHLTAAAAAVTRAAIVTAAATQPTCQSPTAAGQRCNSSQQAQPALPHLPQNVTAEPNQQHKAAVRSASKQGPDAADVDVSQAAVKANQGVMCLSPGRDAAASEVGPAAVGSSPQAADGAVQHALVLLERGTAGQHVGPEAAGAHPGQLPDDAGQQAQMLPTVGAAAVATQDQMTDSQVVAYSAHMVHSCMALCTAWISPHCLISIARSTLTP